MWVVLPRGRVTDFARISKECATSEGLRTSDLDFPQADQGSFYLKKYLKKKKKKPNQTLGPSQVAIVVKNPPADAEHMRLRFNP